MPGIAGIISSQQTADCERLVNAMIASMRNEIFYVGGTHSVPGMGIYVGWVAQKNSFAASQVFLNEQDDIALIVAGKCGSFQLVVSGGVLEHVKRAALPTLIGETERVLKPGGWAVHSIDTADHLEHYDRKVSPKMYLSFSDDTWNRLFENEVQYINRMQRGEWLDLFERNGFERIEEESRRVDISKLRLANKYKKMERSDLECTVLKVALQKPTSAF